MKRPSAKLLARAVLAGRLYAGSMGCTIVQQQRLYTKYMKAADQLGANEYPSLYESLANEVSRQGALLPTPGKDI